MHRLLLTGGRDQPFFEQDRKAAAVARKEEAATLKKPA